MEDQDNPSSAEDQWWYCLRHSRAEQGAGCPNKYRLGPYPDEESAVEALRTVAERNEAWDQDEGDT